MSVSASMKHFVILSYFYLGVGGGLYLAGGLVWSEEGLQTLLKESTLHVGGI